MTGDLIDIHSRALDQVGDIVDQVAPHQMANPTPCTDWDVRTLLSHLVAGNRMFTRAVSEGIPGGRQAAASDLLGDDPAGAYRASAEALKEAWRRPNAMEGRYTIPIGTLPAPVVSLISVVEKVVHGWDVACAIGVEPRFDDDVIAAALTVADRHRPARNPGPGDQFAREVTVPADASPLDRLAGLLGREP